MLSDFVQKWRLRVVEHRPTATAPPLVGEAEVFHAYVYERSIYQCVAIDLAEPIR